MSKIFVSYNFKYAPLGKAVEAHGYQEQYILDAVRTVINHYTPTEKLSFLCLSYENLTQAIEDYKNYFSKQLSDALKAKLKDKSYGEPFSLSDALQYLELEYKSTITFKRLLANGKIPVADIKLLMSFIEEEYGIYEKN